MRNRPKDQRAASSSWTESLVFLRRGIWWMNLVSLIPGGFALLLYLFGVALPAVAILAALSLLQLPAYAVVFWLLPPTRGEATEAPGG